MLQPTLRGLTPAVLLLIILMPIDALTAQSTVPELASLEDLQRLLAYQNTKLKDVKSNAKEVLFFSNGLPEDKTGYCKNIWDAINEQDSFNIPQPLAFAANDADKQKLFAQVYAHAQSNYKKFISQSGKLSPERYLHEEGATRNLGIPEKSRAKTLAKLPNDFKTTWQKDKYAYGLVGTGSFRDFFNKADSVSLLYEIPYPVAGYARPLVLTLVKDTCDQCSDFSIRIRVVGVDGLPRPDFGQEEYFSQPVHIKLKALAESAGKNSDLMTPQTPLMLLKGMGVFGNEFVFWGLHEQTWVEPSAREIEEHLGGYYQFGDERQYFRHYILDVTSLRNPRLGGPDLACSIAFN
jgi:hypothetical protein